MSGSESRDDPHMSPALLDNGISSSNTYPHTDNESIGQPFADITIFMDEPPPADEWYNDEDDLNDSRSLGWSWNTLHLDHSAGHWPAVDQAPSTSWGSEDRHFEQQHVRQPTVTEPDSQATTHRWSSHHRSNAITDIGPPSFVAGTAASQIEPAVALQTLKERLREALRSTRTLQRVSGPRAGSDVWRREAILFSNVKHLVGSIAQQQQFEAANALALDLGNTGGREGILSIAYLAALIHNRLGHLVDVNSFSLHVQEPRLEDCSDMISISSNAFASGFNE